MRDFVAHVRRHLSRQDVAEDRYEEIVDELASELEARYTVLIQRGATDEDAWHAVLAQIPSWPSLAQDLAAAGVGSRLLKTTVAASAGSFRSSAGFARSTLGLRVLRKDRGFTVTASSRSPCVLAATRPSSPASTRSCSTHCGRQSQTVCS